MVLTAPVNGPQQVTNLAASASSYISAGSAASSNFGTLASVGVATSATSDHTVTRVSLVKFSVPASAADGSLTSAVLQLTVTGAPAAATVVSVVGVKCTDASMNSWTDCADTPHHS